MFMMDVKCKAPKSRKTARSRRASLAAALLSLALLLAAGGGSTVAFADGADISSRVNVTDFVVIDSEGQNNSDGNPLEYLESASVQVAFEITMPEGQTMHDGDTFTIGFLPQSQFEYLTSTHAVLYNPSTGEPMGEWWVEADTHTIKAKLNDKVEGAVSIKDGTLTITNLKSVVTTTGEQQLVIGSHRENAWFNGSMLTEPDGLLKKWFDNASGSVATWDFNINYQSLKELGRSAGGSVTTQTNMVLEDVLEAGASFDSITIRTFVPKPLGNGTYLSGVSAFSWDLTNEFTRVTQNPAETYAQFKARIGVLQYGVYTDGAGVQTVLVNFGNLPSNGLSWHDFVDESPYATLADFVNGYLPGTLSASEVAIINQTLWNNSVNGAILHYWISIDTSYPEGSAGRRVNNAGSLINQGIEDSASGNLANNSATGVPERLYARVVKRDVDTNALIGGASFKVQRLVSGTWQDYASAGTLTTATSGLSFGTALYGPFAYGTYRFVETSPAPGYSLPGATDDANASGTFVIAESDTVGVVVSMTNAKSPANNLTVNKTIVGNMGDREKEFHFTVSLQDAAGSPVTGTFQTSGGTITGSDASAPDDGQVTFDAQGKAPVVLKHGQSLTIKELPDCQYSVVETEADNDGYVTTATGDSGTLSASSLAAFTNTLNVAPATGITLDVGPSVLIVLLAALGGVLLLARKAWGIARSEKPSGTRNDA